MNYEQLKNEILENIQNTKKEIKRVFHGRGNFYDDFEYLTIDSIDNLLLISLFNKIDEEVYKSILEVIDEVLKQKDYEIVLLQHRYKKDEIYEVIKGEIPKEFIAYENGLKYSLSFTNQNIGLFFDMKAGREYISSICKDKNVLNLFSYTSAYSVSVISSGA